MGINLTAILSEKHTETHAYRSSGSKNQHHNRKVKLTFRAEARYVLKLRNSNVKRFLLLWTNKRKMLSCSTNSKIHILVPQSP